MAEQIYAEVSGSTSKVVTSLASLENHLQTLNTRFRTASGGATTFANAVKGISVSSQNANLSSLSRSISGIANASKKLETAAPNLAPTLKAVANAINNMPAMNQGTIDSLSSLSASFRSLGTSMKNVVANASQLGGALEMIVVAVNQLPALNAQATKTLTLLGNVAPVATKGAVGVKNLGNAAEKAGRQAKTGATGLGAMLSMAKRYVVTGLYIKAVSLISQAVSNAMSNSADWIEQMNYFNVAYGQMAEKAGAYYTKISEALGIDMSILIQNGAMFEAMSKSLGASSDAAYSLSTNLMAVGIDLASLTGKGLQETFDALQSGVIAGQYKSLAKNYGVNVTQAAIAQEALNLGIDKSVKSMTPLEKAYLRYKVVLRSAQLAQGDMAKTLESPANMTRMFTSAVAGLSRAVGNFLMPILVKIIPYAIAFTRVLGNAFNALAGLLGFKPVTFTNTDTIADFTGGIDDLGDETEGTNDSVEKLKKNIMGFDQFNILSENKSSGSNGTGRASGSSFPMDWGNYDLQLDKINGTKADEAFKKINEALKPLKDTLIKLGEAIAPLLPELKKFWDNYLVPFGNWVIGTGLPALVGVITDLFKWFNENPTAVALLASFASTLVVISGIGKIAVGINATVVGMEALTTLLGLGGTSATTGVITVAASTGFAASIVTLGVAVAGLAAAGIALGTFVTGLSKGYDMSTAEGWKQAFNDNMGVSGYTNGIKNKNNLPGHSQTSGQDVSTKRDSEGNIISVNVTPAYENIKKLREEQEAFNEAFRKANGLPDISHIFPIQAGGTWAEKMEQVNREHKIAKDSRPGLIATFSSIGKSAQDSTKGFNFLSSGIDTANKKINTSTTTILLPTMSAANSSVKTNTDLMLGSFSGMPATVQTHMQSLAEKVDAKAKAAGNALYDQTKPKVDTTLGLYSGMPSTVQAHMQTLAERIDTKAGVAGRALTDQTNIGINTSAGLYSGMPSTVQAHMQTLAEKVDTKAKSAGNALHDETRIGVDNTTPIWSAFSNDGTTKISTFAENVRLALESVLKNMAKLPKNADEARGFSGLTSGFLDTIHNLPMFATGGFPEDGLFAANHGEMVGKFSNGRTAVANNIQIVEGIRYGVAQGVISAMRSAGSNSTGTSYETMYRAFRDVMKDIKFQPAPVVLDGEEVGEVAIRVINKKTTNSGLSPLKA